MDNHFSDDDIRYYFTETRFTERLSGLEQHLKGCDQCLENLTTKKAQLTNLCTYLERDLQNVEQITHPTTKELQAYVKTKLDPLDREIIESHIDLCLDCKKKINEIKTADFTDYVFLSKAIYLFFYLTTYLGIWISNAKEVSPRINYWVRTKPIQLLGIILIFFVTATYGLYQRNLSQEVKVSDMTSELSSLSEQMKTLSQEVSASKNNKTDKESKACDKEKVSRIDTFDHKHSPNNQTSNQIVSVSTAKHLRAHFDMFIQNTQATFTPSIASSPVKTTILNNGLNVDNSLNGQTTYEYNNASNLIRHMDNKSIVVNYDYDSLNRLVTNTYPNTTQTVNYSYDANSRLLEVKPLNSKELNKLQVDKDFSTQENSFMPEYAIKPCSNKNLNVSGTSIKNFTPFNTLPTKQSDNLSGSKDNTQVKTEKDILTNPSKDISTNPTAEELWPIVEKSRKAVCSITTYTQDNKVIDQATGFFDEKGELITNRHVFEKAHTAEIKTCDGKVYSIDGIIAEDKTKDLVKALVKLDQHSISTLPLTALMPSVGDLLIVIGSPMGLDNTVTNGIVSAIRPLPNIGEVIQTNASISHGSSGSPVINMQGQVVAVAYGKMQASENLNFAIPSQAVLSLKAGKLQSFADWNSQKVKEEALELQSQAKNLMSKEDYKKASESLDEIIKLESTLQPKDINYAQIWFDIGTCKGKLNKDNQALDAFNKAIEMKLKDKEVELNLGEVYLSLGAAYSRLGKIEQALNSYSEVTKYDYSDPRVYYNLGVIYSQMAKMAKDKPEEAKSHYQKSIENYLKATTPNSKYSNQAYLGMGIAYRKLEKFNEAVDAYKKAIEIKPDYLEAHNNLAVVYDDLGQYEKAKESSLKAVSIKPNDIYAHFNLGLAYSRLNLKLEALQEYEILKQLDEKAAAQLFDFIYKK